MHSLKDIEENPFLDKRDEQYKQVVSDHRFFDLFLNKKEKCCAKIPDTVILQHGRILKWFFNSKQDNTNEILLKNSDKLTTTKLFSEFSGLKKHVEGMNPLQILDWMRTEPSAQVLKTFLRCTNKEKFLVSSIEVLRILLEQSIQIELVQSMVYLKTCTVNSRETLYSEYRNDAGQTGPLFRFYKKIFFIGKRPELKFIPMEEDQDGRMKPVKGITLPDIAWTTYETSSNYPHGPRGNIDFVFNSHAEDAARDLKLNKLYEPEKKLEGRVKREILRGYMNNQTETTFTKTNDQAANQKLELSTKKIVHFIESAYKIRVRKFVAKFLLDKEGNAVFIGATELRFDLLPSAQYEEDAKFKYQFTCEDLANLAKHTKLVKSNRVILTDPSAVMYEYLKKYSVTSPRERPTSSALYQKLRIKECGGDFCGFFINSPEKIVTGAESKKSDLSDNNMIYMKNEAHEIVHKPFEISNLLKMKCRERTQDVVSILKNNNILPQELKQHNYGYNYAGYDDVFYQHLTKAFSQGKEVENIMNLYRTVKVCKICYTVYVLMKKHFDKHDIADDSYFQFQQKYSKIGLPGSFRKTHKSQSSHQIVLSDTIHKDLRLETVPNLGEEAIKAKISPTSMQSSNRGSYSQRKFSIPDLKLNLSKGLRTQTEGSDKDSSHKQHREKPDNEVFINLTEAEGRPGKKKSSVRSIASARPHHRPSSSFGEKFDSKLKLLAPKTIQAISSSCLKLGVASKVYSPKELGSPRSRSIGSAWYSKKVNLYDTLSDNPRDYQSMKIKKYTGLTSQPVASTPVIDFKRPTSFEGLIKTIHIESGTRERLSLMRQKSQELVEKLQNQQSRFQKKVLRVDALYSGGFRFVRHIQPNKITTSKIPYDLIGAKMFEDIKTVALSKYCEKMNISAPTIKGVSLRFFIYSTNVGFAYTILESNIMEEGQKIKNLVVYNDLFDNFIDYIQHYQDLVDEIDHVRIILFNLPGQAFTSFDPQSSYNNEMCSDIVDTFLFHLDETGIISFKEDNFYFAGFGFGGNIIANIMHNTQDIIQNIKGVLVINSFTRVEPKMTELLDQLYGVLSECPRDMPDLPYNYSSILYGGGKLSQKELDAKVRSNPISVAGRLSMIRGVQNCIDITRQFQAIKTPIFIVRSSKNCMVPLEHMDLMMKISRELEFIYEEKLSTLMKNKILITPLTGNNYLRKTVFYEGPHNIIEQKPADLIRIMQGFLNFEKDKDALQSF